MYLDNEDSVSAAFKLNATPKDVEGYKDSLGQLLVI